jgi:hypothetical protein
MKRVPHHLLGFGLGLTLLAGVAHAQTVSYILIPTITPGVTETKVEMLRQDLTLSQVQTTFVGEGKSGLGVSPKTLKVYIGPSTSRVNPLLDLSPVATSGGMAVIEPVPGLSAVEVSFEVEEEPIRTAWKLPLLTADQFFRPGTTAFVQNLVKNTDAASNLQIFNIGIKPATCNVIVLRPKGTAIEERDGISVPPIGVIRIADILKSVGTGTATGINAAVSCDQPFYALGALPAVDRWSSRVEYPVAKLPTTKTAVTVASMPGEFLRVTKANSFLNLPLPFDPATNYHTVSINFDITVADPPGFVVFRNVAGLFRSGGRRFGKTLYFGSFENFGKGKYVVDVGTPFIETTLKRPIDLSGHGTYHFAIDLDNDQRSLHYVITQNNGKVVVMDILGGLYNPIGSIDGNVPTLQFGLPGVADNAYFPPYGWHYQNLTVVATK